jgi:hypothetical protein
MRNSEEAKKAARDRLIAVAARKAKLSALTGGPAAKRPSAEEQLALLYECIELLREERK